MAPELSLQDEIYFHLGKIEEFKNLSMDMQGQICVAVKNLIEGLTHEQENKTGFRKSG